MKVIVYKAKDGWRWQARARNGRILANSAEGYTKRKHAVRMATRITMRQPEVQP